MICVCATIIKLPVSYFLCSDRSCRMYHFFRLLSSFSRMFRALNCVWCTHRWPRPEPSLSNLYCVTHFIRVRGNWNKWMLIFLRVALQGPTFKFMEMNMLFFSPPAEEEACRRPNLFADSRRANTRLRQNSHAKVAAATACVCPWQWLMRRGCTAKISSAYSGSKHASFFASLHPHPPQLASVIMHITRPFIPCFNCTLYFFFFFFNFSSCLRLISGKSGKDSIS